MGRTDKKDFAATDAATAELQNAWQAASAKMYQQGGGNPQDFAGANPGAGAQGGNCGGNCGGNGNCNDQEVQDVDFEEVK